MTEPTTDPAHDRETGLMDLAPTDRTVHWSTVAAFLRSLRIDPKDLRELHLADRALTVHVLARDGSGQRYAGRDREVAVDVVHLPISYEQPR